MTHRVPARARVLVARLSALFDADRLLVERLNDAQRRLRGANGRLWSGLDADALGLIYDGDRGVAGQGAGAVARAVVDALRADGSRRKAEAAALEALEQTHWAIHSACCELQSVCEDRRQLAVDVGELAQQLMWELTAAGWTVEAARGANVHELAGAEVR